MKTLIMSILLVVTMTVNADATTKRTKHVVIRGELAQVCEVTENDGSKWVHEGSCY